MSCRSVFTALCATGLQCLAGKTPLHFCPHYPLPLRTQPFLFAGVSHPEDEAGMPFPPHSSTSKSASLPFCPTRNTIINGAVLELAQMTPEHWLSQQSSLT